MMMRVDQRMERGGEYQPEHPHAPGYALKIAGTCADNGGKTPDEDVTSTMTSQRAQAYATALKSLRDLKPSKFTDEQMALFEQTADALFFTDAIDDATGDLVAFSHAELDVIADNERLLPETVKRLKDELDAIGPAPVHA
jgi:hypothetical protein